MSIVADLGYAVFVTDSVTGQPVAIFAYPGEAEAWASVKYARRFRVAPIRWAPAPEVDEARAAKS